MLPSTAAPSSRNKSTPGYSKCTCPANSLPPGPAASCPSPKPPAAALPSAPSPPLRPPLHAPASAFRQAQPQPLPQSSIRTRQHHRPHGHHRRRSLGHPLRFRSPRPPTLRQVLTHRRNASQTAAHIPATHPPPPRASDTSSSSINPYSSLHCNVVSGWHRSCSFAFQRFLHLYRRHRVTLPRPTAAFAYSSAARN